MEWRQDSAYPLAIPGTRAQRPNPTKGFAVLAVALVALWFVGAQPASAQRGEPAGSSLTRCTQKSGHYGIHFLEDFQYFKPMVADIRNAKLHVRHYADAAVPFTDRPPAGGDHSAFGFFDVAYGESFPFLGWNFDREAPDNCLEANGVAFFVQGSAHTLLDMDTESHSVLNTDFRIGGGLQARFARHLSLRLQYFHESTHIGDEFVLGAIDNPAFRRYNVSYEAWEAFLSAENFRHKEDLDGQISAVPVYARAYGGGRKLVSGLTGTFDGEFEAFDFGAGQPVGQPLLTANASEFQLGAELFWDCFELPEDRPDASAFSRLTHFQYLFAAGDLYYRDRYDTTAPERVPSMHLMVGVTYGAYFRGRRSVQWAIHRYDGVNPHGQFRTDEIEYWAVSFGLKF